MSPAGKWSDSTGRGFFFFAHAAPVSRSQSANAIVLMSLSFHLNNLIILGGWNMEQIALERSCAPSLERKLVIILQLVKIKEGVEVRKSDTN